MTKDEENLKLLSIFHYVVAGIAGLFSFFPLIYVGMGMLILCGKFGAPHPDPPPRPLGWVMIFIGAFFFLAGLAFVVCIVLAGRCLTRRRHYTFCLVAAALACTFMPFGTVLGVFTIIALQKDTVRQLFGHGPSSPPVVAT